MNSRQEKIEGASGQWDSAEEGTSWSNPGEFPEFSKWNDAPSEPQENNTEDKWDAGDWSSSDWGESDWGDDGWGDSGWGEEVEETPEEKQRREEEAAERKRQQKIQIELERWDGDESLASLKEENPTVFAAIRSYIEQGELDAFSMIATVNDSKEKIVQWFSDENYAEALPVMVREFKCEQKRLDNTPEEILDLSRNLEKFDAISAPDEKGGRIIQYLRTNFSSCYSKEHFSQEAVDATIDIASYMANNSDKLPSTGLSLVSNLITRGMKPEMLATCLRGVQEFAEGDHWDAADLLSSYSLIHDVDEKTIAGFEQNVIPMMEQGDEEVAILDRKNGTGGSAFAVRYGQYGAADYTIAALTSTVSPGNVNELLCAEREIPTSNVNKFERNRLDALELNGVLYRAREFIHDNMPGVHELLNAMMEYYDSRNDEETHAAKTAELQRIVDDRMHNGGESTRVYVDLDKYVFDLSNYERQVVKRESRDIGDRSQTELSSEVLRRLVENTAHSALEKPHTTDEQLNEIINGLDVRENEATGEVYVDWKQAGGLVEYLNNQLVQHQGDVGIRPSMVSAISYADKIAMHALREISDKDWHELPFDPAFKEFVRFQELTGSNDKYDEQKFDNFYNGLIREMSADYESNDVARGTYSKLQQHVLENLRGVAAKYNSNPNTTYRAGSLWSGNLAHELIGLAAK